MLHSNASKKVTQTPTELYDNDYQKVTSPPTPYKPQFSLRCARIYFIFNNIEFLTAY
jgi:hypothetical protein